VQISKSWIWRSCREEREGARNIASPESSISNDAADDDEEDEDDIGFVVYVEMSSFVKSMKNIYKMISI